MFVNVNIEDTIFWLHDGLWSHSIDLTSNMWHIPADTNITSQTQRKAATINQLARPNYSH